MLQFKEIWCSQGDFKGVFGNFQGCFKGVLTEGLSSKLEGASRGCQGFFKVFKFQGCFQIVSNINENDTVACGSVRTA